METSEEVQANGQSKDLKCNKTNQVNGLNNWMLAFFIIFCCNFAFENVMTYGIIKSPIELTYDFIGFMQVNWWCYVLLFLGYLVQITLCFLNEKLLAMGILPETLGMALHVFISLMLFNLCSVLCLVYKFNPGKSRRTASLIFLAVAGIVAMAHIFLMSVKLWGYAYENKKLREAYNRNKSNKNLDVNATANPEGEEMTKQTIKYPDNVTLKRTFHFMVCTGSCIYRIEGPASKPRNLRKVFAGILRAILIYYAAAFLIYQCVSPEVDKAVLHIHKGQYLNVFESVLKLGLPVNITWLLFFYFYCFGFYLPVFGWFWGTEDLVVARDWWSSENSTIFWTKWNYQVHMWFKECFFLPTLQMGYSKRTAALVVGCVSGILHEYLITVPCRCCYGIATFTMLAQIPLANATTFVQRKYGGKWGNLVLWSFLAFGHASCLILLYYNYIPA